MSEQKTIRNNGYGAGAEGDRQFIEKVDYAARTYAFPALKETTVDADVAEYVQSQYGGRGLVIVQPSEAAVLSARADVARMHGRLFVVVDGATVAGDELKAAAREDVDDASDAARRADAPPPTRLSGVIATLERAEEWNLANLVRATAAEAAKAPVVPSATVDPVVPVDAPPAGNPAATSGNIAEASGTPAATTGEGTVETKPPQPETPAPSPETSPAPTTEPAQPL